MSRLPLSPNLGVHTHSLVRSVEWSTFLPSFSSARKNFKLRRVRSRFAQRTPLDQLALLNAVSSLPFILSSDPADAPFFASLQPTLSKHAHDLPLFPLSDVFWSIIVDRSIKRRCVTPVIPKKSQGSYVGMSAIGLISMLRLPVCPSFLVAPPGLGRFGEASKIILYSSQLVSFSSGVSTRFSIKQKRCFVIGRKTDLTGKISLLLQTSKFLFHHLHTLTTHKRSSL